MWCLWEESSDQFGCERNVETGITLDVLKNRGLPLGWQRVLFVRDIDQGLANFVAGEPH